MKTKGKISVLLASFITAILILTVGILYKNDILIIINEIFVSKKIESLNLSTEDKLSDFDLFYNIITSSFPNLDEVKNTYSIDFVKRKNYYKSLIKNTKSDFEYYCTMTAIIEDLASYHTGFCFPDYQSIKFLNCYNLDNVLADRNLKPMTEYWNKVIEQHCEELSDIDVAEFSYVNGEYLFDSKWSSESYDNLTGSHIVSIDSVNIDEYVLKNISTYKLQYDSFNNKPYRRVLTLNKSHGKKVNVIIENQLGNKFDMEFFLSLEMEIVNTYSDEYKDNYEDNDISNEDVVSYYNEKDDILYLAIKNFKNNSGKEVSEILKNTNESTRIIIDLRDNYGGNINYGKRYIFPYLYGNIINFNEEWNVPTSEYNNVINNKLLNNFYYDIYKNESSFRYELNTKYEGKCYRKNSDIFYLVNKRTASATDAYIAMIRENNLGTIIGTNTAGEGLGGSFSIYMLEKSGWVFTYYPCQAYNQDGKNNMIFGTSPNVYISQTADSFNKQRQYEKAGLNVEEYTNRIKWDNILNNALEMIKEN